MKPTAESVGPAGKNDPSRQNQLLQCHPEQGAKLPSQVPWSYQIRCLFHRLLALDEISGKLLRGAAHFKESERGKFCVCSGRRAGFGFDGVSCKILSNYESFSKSSL